MTFSDEMFGDELTDDDLKFLKDWEEMGKSDTANSGYSDSETGSASGPTEAEGIPGDQEQQEQGEEIDPDADGDEKAPGDSGDVDDTRMDISDFGEDQEPSGKESDEQGSDHMEDGEGEIQDGEDELDYDSSYDHADEPVGDESADDLHDENGDLDAENSDADLLGESDAEEEREHPENYEYDTDAKIEEDDGEGERGNSDEARESDEPIHAEEVESAPEAKADAESENDEMDAQQELDDHLKENEDAEPEQKAGKTDEPAGEPDQKNAFEGVPDAGEACTNHCEDNPDEDDHDGECPHCTSRIKRERELWGPIGTDMNDKEIWPGDKLRVQLPISFMVMGSILTANVPNQAVDPERIAEQTGGATDTTICWLSGRAISQFTGWHMKGAENPIWTFKVGKRIGFVEKIGEPAQPGEHGDNAETGDQLDIEDMIDEIEREKAEDTEREDTENETEELEAESEGDDEPSESEDEPEKEPDIPGHKSSGDLPKHQKARFENLSDRIMKKVAGTFGSTLEGIEIQDIEDRGSFVRVTAKILSRQMVYGVTFEMRRYDIDLDGEMESDDEDDEAA